MLTLLHVTFSVFCLYLIDPTSSFECFVCNEQSSGECPDDISSLEVCTGKCVTWKALIYKSYSTFSKYFKGCLSRGGCKRIKNQLIKTGSTLHEFNCRKCTGNGCNAKNKQRNHKLTETFGTSIWEHV